MIMIRDEGWNSGKGQPSKNMKMIYTFPEAQYTKLMGHFYSTGYINTRSGARARTDSFYGYHILFVHWQVNWNPSHIKQEYYFQIWTKFCNIFKEPSIHHSVYLKEQNKLEPMLQSVDIYIMYLLFLTNYALVFFLFVYVSVCKWNHVCAWRPGESICVGAVFYYPLFVLCRQTLSLLEQGWQPASHRERLLLYIALSSTVITGTHETLPGLSYGL